MAVYVSDRLLNQSLLTISTQSHAEDVTGQTYIVHQTNCTTTSAAGLSENPFHKYPFANTYTENRQRVPGTATVLRGTHPTPLVVNLNAQVQGAINHVDGVVYCTLLILCTVYMIDRP